MVNPKLYCFECFTKNSDNASFCINCGSKLRPLIEVKIRRTCDSCKNEISMDSKFCSFCGTVVYQPKLKNNTPKLIELNPKCPYCNHMFDTLPKRKTRCPKCKNDVYVRTKQTLFDTSILTKDDALVADLFKELFESRNINKNLFLNKRKELSKSLNRDVDSVQTIMAICNDLILELIEEENYHEIKMIYYSMALFQNRRGMPTYDLRREGVKYELLHMQKNEYVKYVKITESNIEKTCENCKRLNGKVFSLEEALQTMPIPCKECTFHLFDKNHGFCACYYSYEPDEETKEMWDKVDKMTPEEIEIIESRLIEFIKKQKDIE